MSYVLKVELTGKKTGLAEQEDLAGNQVEFRMQSLLLLEEGGGHSGVLQRCQEVRRHKIRKAEAN